MLGTKSRSLNSSLQLGIPINRSEVEKVEDASNGSSTNYVMEKMGIDACGGNDQFAARGRAILWDGFTSTRIAGVKPITLFLGNVRVIGCLGANADDTVFEP